jgi:hypothetical protein
MNAMEEISIVQATRQTIEIMKEAWLNALAPPVEVEVTSPKTAAEARPFEPAFAR